MKYLLDTHILLWWLSEPKKLSKKAQSIIQDRRVTIYVSSASFWEIAIKNSMGRINMPRNLLQILESENLTLLPINPEETLGVIDLPDIHKDPFDRLLIAQAKYYDLIFITRDKIIVEYPVITIKG